MFFKIKNKKYLTFRYYSNTTCTPPGLLHFYRYIYIKYKYSVSLSCSSRSFHVHKHFLVIRGLHCFIDIYNITFCKQNCIKRGKKKSHLCFVINQQAAKIQATPAGFQGYYSLWKWNEKNVMKIIYFFFFIWKILQYFNLFHPNSRAT